MLPGAYTRLIFWICVLNLLAKQTTCQRVGDPVFSEEYRVMGTKHLNVTLTQTAEAFIRCTVTGGVFRSWVKDQMVVGLTASHKIDLRSKDALGAYYCTTQPAVATNTYRAFLFMVSEMPRDSQIEVRRVMKSQETTLRCSSPGGDDRSYKWERYSDAEYKFIEIPGENRREITLSYSELLKEHDSGFTYYRCFNIRTPMRIEFFKLDKGSNEFSMRTLDVDIASVPVSVTPKSDLTLECHKVTATDDAKWYFRSDKNVGPISYTELTTGSGTNIEINNNQDASILDIKECNVQNKGFFRCNVGGVVKYAYLDIQLVVPTIHEYSKQIYDMSTHEGRNELECEIPRGGDVRDVKWRIIKPNGAQFEIPINKEAEGFQVISKDDSKSNQLVLISFMDNPDYDNYRLECKLGDEVDYVTLKLKSTPAIVLEMSTFSGFVKLLECKVNAEITSNTIDFYILDNKDDALTSSARKTAHQILATSAKHYFRPPVNNRNYWFRCTGRDRTGRQVVSEPIPMIPDPILVDIQVDGDALARDKKKAMVEGIQTTIECKFQNVKGMTLKPEEVKLEVNGRFRATTAVKIDDTTFRITLANPTSSDSGNYRCTFQSSTDNSKNAKSNEVTLNWCTRDQFMCDLECKDSSIKCDGKKDCVDGTDEIAATCEPCEPNEVKCDIWRGARPARSCVLKHWLCDGADDCENRYDEESTVAKAWCTNTCINKPWIKCPQNSTCCSGQDKCIYRSYECDREVDCSSGEDENQCCTLLLQSPPIRQVIRERKGSTVKLTCIARGKERPTINWRCNWGHLRSPDRMNESNVVTSVSPDGLYTVEGTLTITNFQESDECLYNCEAITKCKRELSPEMDLKTIS